jgi:hypothetical protein
VIERTGDSKKSGSPMPAQGYGQRQSLSSGNYVVDGETRTDLGSVTARQGDLVVHEAVVNDALAPAAPSVDRAC